MAHWISEHLITTRHKSIPGLSVLDICTRVFVAQNGIGNFLLYSGSDVIFKVLRFDVPLVGYMEGSFDLPISSLITNVKEGSREYLTLSKSVPLAKLHLQVRVTLRPFTRPPGIRFISHIKFECFRTYY